MHDLPVSEIRSPAHSRSAFAIIDPLYRVDSNSAPPDDNALWLYGEGEFECYRLQVLRGLVAEAKLNVGYPGEFKLPSERAWYRCPFGDVDVLRFRACGEVSVRLDGEEIYRAENRISLHEITFDPSVAASRLLLELRAPGDIPALLVVDGCCSTVVNAWEWSDDGRHWQRPKAVSQDRSGMPPHRAEPEETVLLPVGREGGLYDFGREIFGRVLVRSAARPVVVAGESTAEANNTVSGDCEQPAEMISAGDGQWISTNPLAFRYVRCAGVATAELSCLTRLAAVNYRGAFACSDDQLTRIWTHSAYTLRLCMQDFILDGVKRDRLPWVGDLAMSMMIDAYAFGDAEIVRRSLTVLGRAGIERCHLNGIVDYSLWWIISHDVFQLYFGDPAYLRCEWERIRTALLQLEKRCDEKGLLTVSSGDWLFIDWVDTDKLTALQILWQWAQEAAARLAERLGETDLADSWRRSAGRLADEIYAQSWDGESNLWRGIPGSLYSRPSRHAAFLSVISGLARPEQLAAIRSVLLGKDVSAVGTPYMAGFENIALCRLGATSEMIAGVKRYWGGMLECGATTFWEAYEPEAHGNEMYSFYNRPFGKSLCHAWSAGPASFLPQGILGLEPLADGWTRFAVAPCLGDLSWAAATVPTPQGDIVMLVETGMMSLRIPSGMTAEFAGIEMTGEVNISLDSLRQEARAKKTT